MSNINLASWYGLFEDPRKIALVNLLTEKTKQGKIQWIKQQNAIIANLHGSLEVNFVMQPSLLGGQSWQLFTVRDPRGNELVRATPSLFSSFHPTTTVPLPTEASTLTEAVNQLFRSVNMSTGDGLDGAISAIKNL